MTERTAPWRLDDALSGDEQAWIEIVDEFLVQVWQWARACGLDRTDAEDVAQIVWYKLKDRGHTIADPNRLPGWLATTTRREAIAWKARRRVLLGWDDDELPHLQGTTAVQQDPERLAIVGDTRRRLAAAFEELTPACQELLSLCWSGDLDYREIAGILGRSVGSIGPTRQRCLRSLRERAGL